MGEWESQGYSQALLPCENNAAAVFVVQKHRTDSSRGCRLLLCSGASRDVLRSDEDPASTLLSVLTRALRTSTPVTADIGNKSVDIPGSLSLALHVANDPADAEEITRLRSVWRLVDFHASRIAVWTDLVNQRVHEVNSMIDKVLSKP